MGVIEYHADDLAIMSHLLSHHPRTLSKSVTSTCSV